MSDYETWRPQRSLFDPTFKKRYAKITHMHRSTHVIRGWNHLISAVMCILTSLAQVLIGCTYSSSQISSLCV